jgi:hypothetical protein
MRLLLAAGADASKVYGAEANGGSLAGATALHRAVGRQQEALVPLLTTQANMRHTWQGNTPLHLALAPGGLPGVVQALVAAGSPVGVADADGVTAMAIAAGSNNAVHRALLPAMVRRECERYKQLQHARAGHHQHLEQQQQQVVEQQDPAAILTAVVDAVSALLGGSAAPASTKNPDICMSCIQGVMEVLGGATASRLMQKVLVKCTAADAAAGAAAAAPGGGAAAAGPAAAGGIHAVQLMKALSRGCSAALKQKVQVTKQRLQLINRLQQLLPAAFQQPQEQQQRRRQRRGAGVAAGAQGAEQAANGDLSAQAMAAAQAGNWQQFVQLWEQLTGQQSAVACCLMWSSS